MLQHLYASQQHARKGIGGTHARLGRPDDSLSQDISGKSPPAPRSGVMALCAWALTNSGIKIPVSRMGVEPLLGGRRPRDRN
ncbi:hypothetical protein [Streptomyces pseudogriseolus]|uniref:hypothetical protein n=1 Tax=Streptomyces pseudogriseolus TaxID=36817 RepID=UPI003FA1BD52